MESNTCVFCKIISGEIPVTFEYQDDDIVVFKDTKPSAPVHVLVVPKKHIDRLADVTAADQNILGKVQVAIAQMAHKLGIAEAFRVGVNNGKGAGQVIFHLHYHLMGGFEKGGM
jgi:histidine triad (HIT) family protein